MKGKKGITLIALIITIIVMLILVAVTINVAISGGLFGTAKKAVRKTDLAKLQEDWWVIKYADYNTTTDRTNVSDGTLESVFGDKYEQYNDQFEIKNGELVYVGTDETIKQCAKELGIEILPPFETSDYGTILTENKKYTDAYGGEAIIPKGFKVVTEGQKISDGLVIQDASGNENESGNEFVWIPVTYTKKNTDTNNNGYDDGFDEVFYRSDWVKNSADEVNTGGKRGTDLTNSTAYTEPYSTNSWEVAEYNAMIASVEANKGFYIGRYEAGSTEPRTSESGKTTMVVKKNQYPYNHVTWGSSMTNIGTDGAVYLSQQMYPKESEDYGVASTLCYGVQWDAVLEFIKDPTHDVTNSSSWGNHFDADFVVTNTNAKYSSDNGASWAQVCDTCHVEYNQNILLTTGAADRNSAKHIYDIAGNVEEWTMEVYPNGHRAGTRIVFLVAEGSIIMHHYLIFVLFAVALSTNRTIPIPGLAFAPHFT